MKESQIFNRKDSQRTLQSLTIDPTATDTSTSLSDMVSGGLYDYMTYTMGSGTKYQQLIRNEVIDGINLAGSFVIDPTTGALWTWGQNDQGQLGDGTTANRSSPVSVLLTRVIVSCQRDLSYNTFALDTAGTVWAWGTGTNGALGNNTITSVSSPTTLVGGRQFAALATGVMPAAQAPSGGALDMNGYAWVWGNNNVGQLGQNTTATVSSPVSVIGGRQFVALNRNGRAIDLNNQAWAWGGNSYGQLGIGSYTSQSSPTSVVGVSNITKIASSGPHTLFLTRSGTVYGAGFNGYGQLGDGTIINRNTPVLVNTGNNKIIDIATGLNHSVLLDQYGKIWTFGSGSYGQLGNNVTQTGSMPTFSYANLITGYGNPVSNGALGLLDSNSNAWIWGYGQYGQLGNGTTNSAASPTQIPGQWRYLYYATDGMGFCALDMNSYAWTWGCNNGELGDGTLINYRNQPVSVLGGRQWNAITLSANLGYAMAAGLDSNSYAWHWGNITGLPISFSSPASVLGNRQFSRIIPIGDYYSVLLCALDANSYAWMWGDNGDGSMGNNSTTPVSSPVSVLGNHQWRDIKVGTGGSDLNLAVGLDLNSYAWTWGFGGYTGSLGDGTTTTYKSSPVSVVGNHQFIKTAVSYSGAVAALDNNSYAWIWGANNSNGHLGNNTTNTSSSPVSVVGGRQFTDISMSIDASGNYLYVVALAGDGSVWSWGSNQGNQLGNGTTLTSQSSPVSVLGLTGISAISTHSGNPFALNKTTNTLWAWGSTIGGKLGDGQGLVYGSINFRSSPVSVINFMNTYTQFSNSPISVPTITRFVAISATDNQTFGLDTDGNAWQLGQNQVSPYNSSPISASKLAGCTFSLYGGSTMAFLDGNNYAWTWGWDNTKSQFGNGTQTISSSPVSVLGGHQWQQVTLSPTIGAIGLDLQSYAWTWGANYNGYGWLGDGTTQHRSSPVSVVGGLQFKSLLPGAGQFVVGLDPNGYAWQWGNNINLPCSSPVSVAGGRQFLNFKPSNYSGYVSLAVALDTNSYAWTWGYCLNGEAGSNTTLITSSPVSVVGNRQWQDISVGLSNGSGFVVGLDANSYAWSWGGSGFTPPMSSPVSVIGNRQWKSILAFFGNVIALDSNSYAWSWGYNSFGQLGDGTATTRSSPVSVLGGLQFSQVVSACDSSGQYTTIALNAVNSSLWGWGNGYQYFGGSTAQSSPISIAGPTNIKSIVAQGQDLVAIDGQGRLWSVGMDATTPYLVNPLGPSYVGGQLGDGSTINRSIPVLLSGSLHAKNKRGS